MYLCSSNQQIVVCARVVIMELLNIINIFITDCDLSVDQYMDKLGQYILLVNSVLIGQAYL